MSEISEHSFPILPGGTVTFLFTDIEGSTQLLDQLRDQYADLLAGHHHIIRVALEQWHGREVDTQGDAFFAAFPKATEAVAAVAQIQRALAEHSWPVGAQVRVRMGLHTGEPWLVEEGYVGMDVHRAARIGYVGYGGQVLLSETTTALVQNELPEGVTLLDLGRHRLKDMRRPEPIQQLVIEGLPSKFPPLKSLEALPTVQVGSPGGGKTRLPRPVGPSPYRGLAAFQESDAELFFGREAFIRQLALAVGDQQLVAVIIGPSGAGKSSVVFAGLLPQLREKGNWLIVEMRPGARPFHALAGAMIPTLEEDLTKTDRLIETQKLAQAMRNGEISLFQVANLALSQRDDANRLLLVIDQFEEIFTLRPDPEDQQLFLDELLAAAEVGASHRRAPLVLLLTLRADFMGQALSHRPFTDALQEGSLILGPMNREELQAAVEKPAELAGAAFEPGLVPRILDDIGEEPGNLPLLEFALTLLWERLEDGWMTHAAYDEIGRVDGALARYAEEVWQELNQAEREGARPLFVQLVQPGEGTEDTRRVARRSELAPGHWALVQHLADRRLVVTGRDDAGEETVEVVHEALIRGWERLRTWMIDDRAFRTWQEGLRVALRGWESSGRDEGSLLRAAPLALALEWAEEHRAELSANEVEFIEASRQFSEKQAAEEEARRQRELETAQKLAETEHARAKEQEQAAAGLRRRAYFLGGVLVVAVLLAIAAIFFANQSDRNARTAVSEANQRATAQAQAEEQRGLAEQEAVSRATAQAQAEAEAQIRATAEAEAIVERQVAEEQASLARSRELAAQAIGQLEGDQELAILLAIEAMTTHDTFEASNALHAALLGSSLRGRLPAHEGGIGGITFSPNSELMATTSTDGTAKVWLLGDNELLFETPFNMLSNEVDLSAYFSPDGSRLITLDPGEAFNLAVWDTDTWQRLETISLPISTVNMARFDINSDLSQVAVGYSDGEVSTWDLQSREKLADLPGFDIWVEPRYSPDGTLLATYDSYGGSGKVIIWDTATWTTTKQVNIDDGITIIEVSPDNRWLAVASQDEILLWDLNELSGENNPPDTVLRGHGIGIFNLDFTKDSRQLVSGGRDQTVRIWDVLSGRELYRQGTDATINYVVFTPDGNHLVAGDDRNALRFWDLTAAGASELFALPTGDFSYAELSPGGNQLATGQYDGVAKLWNLETGQEEQIFEGHEARIMAVDFHPTEQKIATASMDGSARVWDMATGEELLRIEGHEVVSDFFTGVLGIAYSPDGRMIATSGGDGKIRTWDAATGEALLTLDDWDNWATWVAFSPDGSMLASGGELSNITIWDPQSGQELLSFPAAFPDRNIIWRIAFSPDGRLLAVSGTSGVVKVWAIDKENASSQLLATLTGHTGIVRQGMDISSDGRLLATAADDGTRLWDLSKYYDDETEPGEPAPTVLNVPGRNPLFNPQGDQLMTLVDGSLLGFTLDNERLLELAQLRVTRSFTAAECDRFNIDPCPAQE